MVNFKFEKLPFPFLQLKEKGAQEKNSYNKRTTPKKQVQYLQNDVISCTLEVRPALVQNLVEARACLQEGTMRRSNR